METRSRLLIIALLSLFLAGCFEGFKPDRIIKHPDSSMLILEAKPGYVRVAVYSKVDNKMIEFGWVKADERLIGWTITKYDWESFIEKKENEQ